MRKFLITSVIIIFPLLLAAQVQLYPQNRKLQLIKLEEKKEKSKKYLISNVNVSVVKNLAEPLKALAAYYACVGGSDCNIDVNGDEFCHLTSELKLGKQGSNEHIQLIKKWFHDDAIVDAMVENKCFLEISGSNDFSNFEYLTFLISHDTVFVKYKLLYYNSGKSSSVTKIEAVIVKNSNIVFIKQDIDY